jgi:hypothetical protein
MSDFKRLLLLIILGLLTAGTLVGLLFSGVLTKVFAH